MATKPSYEELEQRVKDLGKGAIKCKQAEEALRKSQERYRAILEDQTELICRFTVDGTLTYVNEAYCRHFVKKPEKLIGQKFKPLIPREDHGKVKEHFSLFSPENNVLSKEHRVIAPNGEIRWQRWTNRAIYDVHGNLAEFQSVGRDITERKRAQEALQIAHDTLEQRVKERTSQLQDVNERLEKLNTGLQVLMEHRQEVTRQLEKNIVENANKLITPYIEKMDKKRMGAQNRAYLEVIASGLKELVSPFANTLSSKEVVLSPTEVRVADLIRQGKTSKEIASLMNVSANAITVHRYNIRRKLGLLNKKVNLSSYLQSLST